MKNETFPVSIANLYGDEWLKNNASALNEKYDWEFRIPKDGDQIAHTSSATLLVDTARGMWTLPRIILTPKKDPIEKTYGVPLQTIKDWLKITEYELTDEFRKPNYTEKFVSDCSQHHAKAVITQDDWDEPRLIVKLKKPTLREVYNKDAVILPAGYKWTKEFREPKDGEWFLTMYDFPGIRDDYAPMEKGVPTNRLILEKVPPTVYFKAESKSRTPKEGDWYTYEKAWQQATSDFSRLEYICGTRHEEPSTHVETVYQSDLDKLGL